MSKIALKPNASGTGVFSLEAPDSNVDRTLTLPDEEGTVATIENIPPGYEDQDALDLFNVTGSAPVYACRAWVNFDGTGTISIRDSGNVSSITDNGTGKYGLNFSNSMPDSNYFIGAIGVRDTSVSSARIIVHDSRDTRSVSTVEIRAFDIDSTTDSDQDFIAVQVIR